MGHFAPFLGEVMCGLKTSRESGPLMGKESTKAKRRKDVKRAVNETITIKWEIWYDERCLREGEKLLV
jgi:hypothetical protein